MKVLYEIQSRGYAKNLKRLEELIAVPYNTFYQVKNGSRGIPKQHRAKIEQYLEQTYKVNPKIFSNLNARVFTSDLPILEDEEPEYAAGNKSVTSGTFAELAMLKAENQVLRSKLETQAGGVASNTSGAFAARTMAFQEVVMELLAGISGTTFEEVFARVRNKEVEFEKIVAATGTVYSNRK